MVGGSDVNLAEVCRREGRAIVTLDLDFSDIRSYPPSDYAGIIVLRPARLGKPHVLSIIRRLLPLLEDEPLSAKLWIVDETSVRVGLVEQFVFSTTFCDSTQNACTTYGQKVPIVRQGRSSARVAPLRIRLVKRKKEEAPPSKPPESRSWAEPPLKVSEKNWPKSRARIAAASQ